MQAVACEGVAKLMLAGMISDETVRCLFHETERATTIVQSLIHTAGPAITCSTLLFTRNGGQSSSPTMFDLFLAGILLLVDQ